MQKLSVLLVLLLTVGCGHGNVVAYDLSKTIGKTDCDRTNRITLRKNIPFAEQVKDTNTIYVIRHDFDLNGSVVNIPAGCVLKFKGGRVTDGSILLNNTYLEGKKGFQNVVLSGSCCNNVLSSELFVLDKKGTTDNSVDVQSLFNIGVDSICFSKGTYSFSDIQVGNVSINANGSTFISTLAAKKHSVINNVFVANNTDYFKLYYATIKGKIDGSSKIQQVVLSPVDLTNVDVVEIKGCIFKELRYACYQAYANGLYDYRGVSLSCHGCKNVLVDNCEFYDMMPSEWIWIAPSEAGTRDDVENVCIRNNYFHNPEDNYERSNTPVNVFSKSVIFEGNLLEYQKYAGSAFNLQCRNVIVHDNVVRNSYFKSIVDVCEYGDFCNDFVAVYNNDFSSYNSQCVVANAKELIVRDNRFEGISAVLAFATYHNPLSKHAACVDYATDKSTPNQKVIIEKNYCNCDFVDTTWLSGGKMVHGGYCSGFTIQSLYCNSDSVNIRNNRLYIRKINPEIVGDGFTRQPVFVRNAKNINVSNNYFDSDIPAVGSKYKGAVYILVYNRDRELDAKLTEVESVNIIDNEYHLISDDLILYTTRISGYSDNTADWVIKSSNISNNVIHDSLKKDKIYTTGGNIEKLTVKGGKVDVKNSPAVIKDVKVVN